MKTKDSVRLLVCLWSLLAVTLVLSADQETPQVRSTS